MKLRTGAFVVSLDLELAWGAWQQRDIPWQTFAGGREYALRLDALAQTYGMPFTFAVVGAIAGVTAAELADADPTADVGTLRPELGPYLRPLPAIGDISAHPDAWLSADLASTLAMSPAHHDIGSHTFFHATPTTPESLVTDIRACGQALPGPLKTLVYPRNRIAYPEALARGGITAYRGTTLGAAAPLGDQPSLRARVLHTLEQLLGRPAKLATMRAGNPTEITSSAILTLRTGIRRRIPTRMMRQRFLRPLDHAVKSRGIYHLWSHPWNFALPGSDAFELMSDVCERAAVLRDRGDLEVLSMKQLVDRAAGAPVG